MRAHLVDYNDNYIGIGIGIEIGIGITRNTKYCNVIFIAIHLFDDNIIIEFEDNEMKAF